MDATSRFAEESGEKAATHTTRSECALPTTFPTRSAAAQTTGSSGWFQHLGLRILSTDNDTSGYAFPGSVALRDYRLEQAGFTKLLILDVLGFRDAVRVKDKGIARGNLNFLNRTLPLVE